MTTTFVVDTDPGIDDALALLLAARASAARLGAVTVTYGNTTLDRAARNARTTAWSKPPAARRASVSVLRLRSISKSSASAAHWRYTGRCS